MNLNKKSIVDFIKLCQRVLHVSKKPGREEFMNVAKITGIGVIIIGAIGFIISIVAQLLYSAV
ncbi:MAG TPA: protein translocase SEC61 complex subunit gamma [Methanobacterium sp.]|jgi:protein transport protein SEC61 subunit gamma and related proteins|nr:protein translocase SEC61 complex subunit gamma [Methanobacterium sp.]